MCLCNLWIYLFCSFFPLVLTQFPCLFYSLHTFCLGRVYVCVCMLLLHSRCFSLSPMRACHIDRGWKNGWEAQKALLLQTPHMFTDEIKIKTFINSIEIQLTYGHCMWNIILREIVTQTAEKPSSTLTLHVMPVSMFTLHYTNCLSCQTNMTNVA